MGRGSQSRGALAEPLALDLPLQRLGRDDADLRRRRPPVVVERCRPYVLVRHGTPVPPTPGTTFAMILNERPARLLGGPFEKWCGREDSNFHRVTPTATSTLRVYRSATTALRGIWGRDEHPVLAKNARRE